MEGEQKMSFTIPCSTAGTHAHLLLSTKTLRIVPISADTFEGRASELKREKDLMEYERIEKAQVTHLGFQWWFCSSVSF